MRVCQRCSKRISDDRTICRDCGGILEEVPDDELPRETITSSFPDRSEQEPCDGLESLAHQTSDALIADESSFVESDARQVDKAEGPEWKCDQCGEMVPGTFDVCWNCTAVEEPVSGGLLVAPAAQAFRCSSCGALLTNFKDPN